jgi:hypothetical protein
MKYLNALLQEAEHSPHPREKDPTEPTKPVSSVLSGVPSRSTENFKEPSTPLCSCGIPATLSDATGAGSQIYCCHQCGYAAIVPTEPGKPYTLTEEEKALYGGFYAAVHFLRVKLTTPQPIASLIQEWAKTERSLDILMEARWALKVTACEGEDGAMWWTLPQPTLQ